jgi:hypothetical protein
MIKLNEGLDRVLDLGEWCLFERDRELIGHDEDKGSTVLL